MRAFPLSTIASRGGFRRSGLCLAGLWLAGLWTTWVFAPIAYAAETAALRTPSVIVQKASVICFSSRIRTTGFLVPRTPAAVMFNAPGFEITHIAVADGDSVTVGQEVATVTAKNAPADQTPTAFVLRSPVAGLVINLAAKVGVETSAGSPPLATMATNGEIEALVDIPSIHVVDLNAGQDARVTLVDGREFGGHVRLVPVEINRATQGGQARISIDNAQALKTGTFAHISIDSRRSCGVAVPVAAIIHSSEGSRVQVVKEQTIATKVVTLGLLDDVNVEVTGGLAEGDYVVANAGTSLRDGDKVMPIGPDLQEVRP